MQVRAVTKFVKISPRKVRLVVDVVRGKPVQQALDVLKLMPQRSATVVYKTVKSAASNAENNYNLDITDLVITRITADDGPRRKTYKPKARGRAGPVLHRMSHVSVVVEDKGAS